MTHTQTPTATTRAIQSQIFAACVAAGRIPPDSWDLGAIVIAQSASSEGGELHERRTILQPRDMTDTELEAILERALADVRQRRSVD